MLASHFPLTCVAADARSAIGRETAVAAPRFRALCVAPSPRQEMAFEKISIDGERAGRYPTAVVRTLLAKHGKVVLKPRRGSGARGVVIASTMQDFDAWQAGAHQRDDYEVEEFIDGTMYSLNPMIIDGEVPFMGAVYYHPGMADGDFMNGTPCANCSVPPGPLVDKFVSFSADVARGLGMRDGVLHLECFVQASGDIVFCEAAARPGGGGTKRVLESQYAFQFSRAALLIEAGCGRAAVALVKPKDKIACVIGFRVGEQQGFVKCIATKDDLQFDWTTRIVFSTRQDAFVTASAHCGDFIVAVDFVADDIDDFKSKVETLNQRFSQRLVIAPP